MVEDNIDILVRGVLIQEGKVLLLERTKTKGGGFNLVGGHVEKGESPAEALRREIREEIGVRISLKKTQMMRVVYREKSGRPPKLHLVFWVHDLIGLPTYQQTALAILNRESDRLFADPRSSVDWARMTLIRKEGMKLLLHPDPSDSQVQQIIGQYRPGYLSIGGNLAEEKLLERGHDPREAEFWVCPADYGDCLPFRDLEEVSAYLNGE